MTVADQRFDFLALGQDQQRVFQAVYEMLDRARMRGGYHESDSRAIIDGWRSLRYLMRPVAEEKVVKVKDPYPDLPSGYVSSES